jgi:large subunit ribosomal protein L40e
MDLAQTLLEDSESDGGGIDEQIGKSTCSRSISCGADLFLRCLDPTWQLHPPEHEILKHTIYEVKRMIADKEGVPPNGQRLRFGGIPLEDARTLEKLQHQEDAALLLLEQTRSGVECDEPNGKPPNTLIVRTLRNSGIRLSVLTVDNIQKSKQWRTKFAKCQRLMHGIVESKGNLTLDYYHIRDNGIIDELLQTSHRCDYCDSVDQKYVVQEIPLC